jgi:hypothetical protein
VLCQFMYMISAYNYNMICQSYAQILIFFYNLVRNGSLSMNKIPNNMFTNVPIANIKIQILNQTKMVTSSVKNADAF